MKAFWSTFGLVFVFAAGYNTYLAYIKDTNLAGPWFFYAFATVFLAAAWVYNEFHDPFDLKNNTRRAT